jgi:hypothetical protein
VEEGSSSTHLEHPSFEQYNDPDWEITPRYWVDKREVDKRLADCGWEKKWFLGFRDISNTTNERSFIVSIIPKSAVANNFPLIIPDSDLIYFLAGNLSSLPFDYIARQKIGGTHLNYFYVKQFPVLPPEAYNEKDKSYIKPRVLELVYTSHSLRDFAKDMGYDGEPFGWDEERRANLKAELDAYYAHLYGLTRDELLYILDPEELYGKDFPGETFRVLKNKEMNNYGEYRTKRLIMQKWDEMFSWG